MITDFQKGLDLSFPTQQGLGRDIIEWESNKFLKDGKRMKAY